MPTLSLTPPSAAPCLPADLASCLESMEVALEILNERDQRVWYDKPDHCVHKASSFPEALRKRSESLQSLEKGVVSPRDGATDTGDIGGVKVDHRPKYKVPALQEFPEDRWFKNLEAMTPDGYLLVVRINVTELVRLGRKMEAKYRQLDHLSNTDSMTGLANRRRFDEALHTEWQRASRNGNELSLLMVDIDHFKKYNDRYGHLAGDVCLRRVAQVLRNCTRRAGDLAARYGGEEFVMLLPATGLSRAREVAEKCMQEMQLEGLPHAASPTSPFLTLSIGVACLSDFTAVNATGLVNAADAAMYRAKAAGRARYAVACRSDWEIDADTPRSLPSALRSM